MEKVFFCRERKPGECCEQKKIISHCLDLHDQRKGKLFEKLVLIDSSALSSFVSVDFVSCNEVNV